MCNKKTKLVGIHSNYQDATDKPARLTDDQECDFVMLSVWNTEDDGADSPKPTDLNNLYDESREEVYWGFSSICVHQLFPKETTRLIPVQNAKDIFIRA